MSDISLSVELSSSAAKVYSGNLLQSQRPRSLSTGSGHCRSLDDNNKRPANAATTKQQQQLNNPNRYKTELCRPFQESGQCRYGDKCQFAHGKQDLRTPIRHPKYKTEFCRTYHSQGYCPYGARCHFIHSTIEARPGRPSGLGIINPSQTNFMPFTKPPLSPSQDSGISSPGGTPNSFLATKVFEYPLSDSSSDDQDVDVESWKTPETQFAVDSEYSSPVKLPATGFSTYPFDELSEQFSSTSLDDNISFSMRSRLPVFDRLNSFSDTALCGWH